MLGFLFQTIQNGSRLCFVTQPNGIRHLRMSFGQCSRLIQDYRIDLLSHLQAFGILNQDTILRSLSDTYHDSRRCSQSQSTRTSDNQYRNQSQHAMRKSVFRSQQNPCNQRHDRYRNDDRYKYSSNLIDQLLHGCLTSLRILYHADDLGKQGILSDFISHETECSFLINGSGKDFGSFLFADRKRFSAEHTLVHIGLSFTHHTVDRYAFPWFYDNRISLLDRCNRKNAFSFGSPYRNGFRLQTDEFPNGCRSIPFGPFFQQSSQQDESNNHTRSLEIDMRFDASFQPKFRKEKVEDTEHIRNPRTECHQSIHVACTMLQLFPSTDKEAPTQYEDNGSRQQPHHIVYPIKMHKHHA